MSNFNRLSPKSPADYFAAIDATWPAIEYKHTDHFTCRRGAGAGMRVSAITMDEAWTTDDITAACEITSMWGQYPIFSIRPWQSQLDNHLAKLGYKKCFETLVLTAPSLHIAKQSKDDEADVCSAILLQIQREIWQTGGHINKARWEVMDRVATQKTYLLGRLYNRPSGTGFISISNEIAMLHALDILPTARRQGLGTRLTTMAADWAVRHDAHHFSLLVTAENKSARALYKALGMEVVSKYHYRVAQ